MFFEDRVDAGRKLAGALLAYQGQDVVVYALPRGGVVLGAEVAKALHAPLDLVVVRKVGHPLQPEYAIAAIAEDGHLVRNPLEVESVDQEVFEDSVRAELREAERRRELYTRGRARIAATNKTAILVDDGLATGLTMFAAVELVRHAKPRKIVVAVPVAPPQAVQDLRKVADQVVTLLVTPDFGAIGSFYRHFDQVTDEQVIALMRSVSIEHGKP